MDETNKNIMNHLFQYLTISIVDHCNYNCKNCIHFTAYRPKKEHAAQNFIAGLKLMIEAGILSNQDVLLSNEPFLHSDLLKFVEELSSSLPSIPIVICSNGFWLSERAINKYQDMFKKVTRLTITQYPGTKISASAIAKLKTMTNVMVRSVDEFAAPSFSSTWSEPIIPDVVLANSSYCRFVDCLQLLPDKRLMKCPTGYAGMSSFPVSEEFKNSKQMFYDLEKPTESFNDWWDRYPFDACYYCRLTPAMHELGRKIY